MSKNNAVSLEAHDNFHDPPAELAFYDFPVAHWQSIRTAKPIESTFATICHRTRCSRGFGPPAGAVHAAELGIWAERCWRRLRGFGELGKVVEGVQSKDGIEVKHLNDQMAA